MIGGEHSVTIRVSPPDLWDFMSEFDNWAEFVIGFRSFSLVEHGVSRWVLQGDMGMLSREVELEVRVTEWREGEFARFAIQGVTEDVTGEGSFSVSASTGESTTDMRGSRDAAATGTPRTSWWKRWRNRLILALMRRRRGPVPKVSRPETSIEPGPSDSSSTLRFTLSVAPGGPMAPMLELLMSPLLEPAAEDMARQVKAALEGARR